MDATSEPMEPMFLALAWLCRYYVVSSVGLGDKIDKRAKFRRHSAVPLPDKVPGTGLGFVV